MYTLRTFNKVDEIDRTHIYLGDSYAVRGATKEEEEKEIKLFVFGNWDSKTKEGIAIYKNEYAFVMTSLGGTFETLNRPKKED